MKSYETKDVLYMYLPPHALLLQNYRPLFEIVENIAQTRSTFFRNYVFLKKKRVAVSLNIFYLYISLQKLIQRAPKEKNQ